MALPTNCDFIRDFVLGDLIYGTTFDRRDYISAATEKLHNDDAKVTIDRLTRQLDTALRGWGDHAKDQLSQEQFEELPQSAQTFLVYAKKWGPMWAKMKGEGVTNYTKHGVAKARPDLGNRMQWSSSYMRAKCKVGIGFVLDSGFSVRFALDSLWSADSMEVVARKETGQPWHTGSELRWLYKHRDHQNVQAGVIYYVNGWRVAAPWERFAASWARYGETRIDRIPDQFLRD